MQRKNMWKEYTEDQQKELEELSVRYKECLDIGKTERECVKLAVEMAKEAGYQDIKDVLKEGKSLKAGDKVYAVCMEKMLAMFRMGEEPLSNGMNIPIIAITAGTEKEERKKCLKMGMNDYIPKPIIKGVIEEVILKWIAKN